MAMTTILLGGKISVCNVLAWVGTVPLPMSLAKQIHCDSGLKGTKSQLNHMTVTCRISVVEIPQLDF